MTNLTTTQPARHYTPLSAPPEQTAQSATTAQQSRAGTSSPLPSTSSETDDTTASVHISLSQAGLDFLANRAAYATSRQASAQEALVRLDQLARSSHTAAREEAEARVNTLKAQIHQLMQIKDLLSPKALAQELAQLARQLAAAVAQYTQNGGSDAANAAAGNAVLASAQATPQTAPSLPAEGATTQTQQAPATPLTAQPPATAPALVTKTENNQDFSQAVQTLSEQMKDLLAQNRLRLKKLHITSDSDTQNAQNTLATISLLIPNM